MPAVNHAILRWAREAAGLTLESAQAQLGIAPGSLAAIERGERPPSRPQLLRMAKTYRRPLLTFYLAVPPRKGERGQDFRTLPDRLVIDDEVNVDVLVRDLKARQGLVRAALLEDDDAKVLTFIGSMTRDAGAQAVADSIRSTIDFDLDAFRRCSSPEDAFGYLRARVEDVGIFVVLVGNLGSHHTEIPVEVFRGFAIADDVAPLVAINDGDARSAWSFTLLHEVAHLWLGTTGISGARAERQIERFCNEVAAQILLPAGEAATFDVDGSLPVEQLIEVIAGLAAPRRLSQSMVAYRLLLLGRITEAQWDGVQIRLRQMWNEQRKASKRRARESGAGPSYYVVRQHRLGPALLRFARQGLESGALTPTKAAKVLGVKPRAVYPLLAAGRARKAGR